MITLTGELIDVSIPHVCDDNIEHFYNNLNKYVTTYTFKFEEKNLNFKSYTIEYLTNDIEHILFENGTRPWEDKKYKKRLGRLLYMYFILLLLNNNYNLNLKVKYLKYIENIMSKLETETDINLMNEFIENTNEDVKKYPYRYIFKGLLNVYEKDEKERSMPENENQSIMEYIKIVKENLELQLELLKDIQKYKSSDIIFTEKQIREMS